jgi:uncharacterized protein (TIGR02757 family)
MYRPALVPALDRLYDSFNRPASARDPIDIVRRFSHRDDIEVVAFCAAALAFGRVSSVMQSIERLLAVMGPSPAAYVRAFDLRKDRSTLSAFVHRWITGADVSALLWILRRMLDRSGSIEGFFMSGRDAEHPGMAHDLERFSARALEIDVTAAYGGRPLRPSGPSRASGLPSGPGVRYFFPRPSTGSACKRLNLFLRWMVRRDALDLGIWTAVSPSELIVPLDTHIVRVGRCLGLTRYVSPGWAMASDITAALRRLDPDDPVRYDFSMCHMGMMNACGFNAPQRDAHCPLRGLCRPAGRRRPRSRRPSARP